MNDAKNNPENTAAGESASDASASATAVETEVAAESSAPESEVGTTPQPEAEPQAAADADQGNEAESAVPDPAPGDAKTADDPNDEGVDDDDAPTVEDQISELRDRLLRAMAELENTRKRAERDREEASKYAVTGFARSVLTVADNLRRAIESVPDEARENETIKTLLDGIELTERELLKVFEQQGIKSIDPLGEKFDHNFHQAMFEVESTGQPNGTVVQVIEAGYVIAGRLLRPAMVGIAKAAPTGEQAGETSPGIDTKV